MNIVIIHGSARKGNTYAATEVFKKAMQAKGPVSFTEFFLPKDMPEFCTSCHGCFMRGEDKCPHRKWTEPMLEAMLAADALIMTSPSYVLGASSLIKNVLDHFGYIFIVHRPREEMFTKKAFIISTTAGAGTRSAIKTIATSLRFWGVNRIYSLGFALHEIAWEKMKPARKARFEQRLRRAGAKFYQEVASKKRHIPYLKTRMMFGMMRKMIASYEDTSLDKQYWTQKGWFTKTPL